MVFFEGTVLFMIFSPRNHLRRHKYKYIFYILQFKKLALSIIENIWEEWNSKNNGHLSQKHSDLDSIPIRNI